MDPQTVWNELLEALASNNLDEAELKAEALITWLDRQGFPPQTSPQPLPGRWDEAICRYVCGKVLAIASILVIGTR